MSAWKGNNILRVPRHVILYFLSWITVIGMVIPVAAVFGYTLIPDRWIMDVKRLDVVFGTSHQVYFTREIKHNFLAHWSVEIEKKVFDPRVAKGTSGEFFGSWTEVCAGGSEVNRPTAYTVSENKIKIFSLDSFTGDEDCSSKLSGKVGSYHMIACWYVPIWIWVKTICKTADFLVTGKEPQSENSGYGIFENSRIIEWAERD